MNALKLVSVILLASIFLVLPVTSATTTITVTVNHPVIHPGQTLVVSGTTSPNVEVGITVFNPQGQAVASVVTNSSSSGIYTAAVVTFPSQANSLFPFGTYTVHVGTSTGFTNSTTFQFSPQTYPLVVQVLNPVGIPVQGATVSINGLTETTNSSGEASFQLEAGTYTLMVSAPGYVTTQKTVTIPTTEVPFVVTLQTQALKVSVNTISITYNGTTTTAPLITPETFVPLPGGTSVTASVTVTYQGSPTTMATVTASLNGQPVTVTSTSTGYMVSFSVPNTDELANLTITANMSGSSATYILPISVMYNPQQAVSSINRELENLSALINQIDHYLSGNVSALHSQLAALTTQLNLLSNALSGNVSALNSKLSNLSTQLNSLTGDINSLTSSLSTLNSSVHDLSGQVNTLQGEYTSLHSQVSSASTIVYGSLAVAVVAIIIAVVALVLVSRRLR